MRDAEGLDAVAFGERLLALLDLGAFTATYKHAVLLALLDVCLEEADVDGAPPHVVHPRSLARRVIELYWPQTGPYAAGGDEPVVLRQNRTGQAEIVRLVGRFRATAQTSGTGSLAAARLRHPDAYENLLDDVTWKLVQMPLPRLQRVGSRVEPFLYDIAWDERVTRSGFADADPHLRLRPGVGEHLVRLAGLLRPLVEHHWATQVVAFNRRYVPSLRDQDQLSAFLFGVDRLDLSPVRDDLRHLQGGACFYCGDRLTAGVDVDHFLPWSRHPDNGIHNLVAAHPRCNNRKRDFLAATPHVAAWVDRFRDTRLAAALDDVVAARRWTSHGTRTLSVARAVYLRLPADVPLWLAGDEFVAPDPAQLAAVLRRAEVRDDRVAAEKRPPFDHGDEPR